MQIHYFCNNRIRISICFMCTNYHNNDNQKMGLLQNGGFLNKFMPIIIAIAINIKILKNLKYDKWCTI